MNADFSHTCEGCEHVVTEPWAKDIISYRCFAPGRCKERGRGFASDREAWAELKECIERTKQMHTDIEKVHKEMWSAVKDRNEDAFAALSQEFERSSRILAEEWAQTSALAKIAVISESND